MIVKQGPPVPQRFSLAMLLNIAARCSSKIISRTKANLIATSLRTHNLTASSLQADTSNLTSFLSRWRNERLLRFGANSWTRRILPPFSVIEKRMFWSTKLRRCGLFARRKMETVEVVVCGRAHGRAARNLRVARMIDLVRKKNPVYWTRKEP